MRNYELSVKAIASYHHSNIRKILNVSLRNICFQATELNGELVSPLIPAFIMTVTSVTDLLSILQANKAASLSK